MLDQINLKQKTLDWFARKQYSSKTRGTLWPSEASAEYINQYGESEIVGKCHRAIYYRIQGVPQSNPPTAKSQVVFLLGNCIEDTVTEAWKQMGIWENNSVRWEDKVRNLSGEFDVILREGNLLYGAECKSYYGYAANKKILGHMEGRGDKKKWNPGQPKDENLMQAAIYVDQTKGDLAGFKLFYVSRDNCDMAEFNITLDNEKNILVNGFKEQRYDLNNVYNRYNIMNEYIINNIKPEREFQLYLSDARVQELYDRDDLSKTAYEEHTKGKEKATDWHCSYCSHKDHCWKVDKDDIKPTDKVTVKEMSEHGSL